MLTHPGICTVYALEELDGELYIATEFVEGHTLRDEIAAGEPPVARHDRRHGAGAGVGDGERARQGHHAPRSQAGKRDAHGPKGASRCSTSASRASRPVQAASPRR